MSLKLLVDAALHIVGKPWTEADMESAPTADGARPLRVVIVLQAGANLPVVAARLAGVRAGGSARRCVAPVATAGTAANAVTTWAETGDVARTTGAAVVLTVGAASVVALATVTSRGIRARIIRIVYRTIGAADLGAGTCISVGLRPPGTGTRVGALGVATATSLRTL